MITKEKAKIYKKYNGDIDGWVRVNDPKEISTMSDQDWYEINLLLQQINGIKKGLASEEYSKRIEKDLADKTADDETVKMLFEMA